MCCNRRIKIFHCGGTSAGNISFMLFDVMLQPGTLFNLYLHVTFEPRILCNTRMGADDSGVWVSLWTCVADCQTESGWRWIGTSSPSLNSSCHLQTWTGCLRTAPMKIRVDGTYRVLPASDFFITLVLERYTRDSSAKLFSLAWPRYVK